MNQPHLGPSGSAAPPPRRRGAVWRWLLLLVVLVIVAGVLFLAFGQFEYAYMPPLDRVANPHRINHDIAYDLWGQPITRDEAQAILQTDQGRQRLSRANGAIPIDHDFLQLGREAFYRQTFGNELFATDVAGILEGPLTPWEFVKAVVRARNQGTDNLRVRVARTQTIGGRTFQEGEMVDTGLDVPRGALVPMGMKLRYARGRVQAGITCAACHAAYDRHTDRVIEGAPNIDINIGTLMAMAPNTAAWFVNAQVRSFEPFITENSPTITTSDGRQVRLPDPKLFEDHVDRFFLSWPPGFFDSTADLVANPSQIPDAFTWQDHPFGWTGFAAVGPFRGLSTLNNNVHALNSDGLAQAEASQDIFGFDKEITYAIVLQNAANQRYRYDPASGQRPSQFFERVNPTPMATGFNIMVPTPTFPKGSLISPDGLYVSLPDHPVWEHINAISAFQNTLTSAPVPLRLEPATVEHGRQIFQAAGCIDCHTGPNYTNNRVLPAGLVGASPARALANANSWPGMAWPPLTWSWDTPVPIPPDARVLEVPTDMAPHEDVLLAHAQDEQRAGGYKVKGLIGLYWSPPYLHDGGVAVGPHIETDLGLPGTFGRGVRPDPVNSLRALVDRTLRARVVRANLASEPLQLLKLTGEGHEHWVDAEGGFTAQDQNALIQYLLSLNFEHIPAQRGDLVHQTRGR